ncbi:putative outer membrane protein [Campylobacter hyointestinalis subsp. hyointestinalis]|uniref:Outer membrane protein n=2 Tax=Campylobacter hyointestinalis TaxID=198 RepID=A0A0S4RC36_CAMHY|nr:hypothetical protein [Campylobacter hyointestinalis]PPB51180.1 hypothetical protein CDQ68_08605 [Campylobacter hyointestinalis subsp. hyointestinalis]PPB68042.1 hypothetical protein CDQ77_08600 [Campylobacter hyointestinalis subsp. hyointestinalis]CUU71654.1 putative outer membrane protein [Campylobacter hyointestinalis subsp. hyointestinalis]CUU74475.1 putative outer membrane protein [Campylobacter hyointestinalis subsp. hyointestinalis]
MSNIVKFSTKVLVASALMSSVVLAEDTFVGVEGAFVQSKVNLDSELNEAFSDPKDGAFEFGFKAGQDFGDYRLWAGYSYQAEASDTQTISYGTDSINAKSTWSAHNFLVGADYTPSLSESFKAVVGAYGGLSVIKAKNQTDGKITFGGSTYTGNGSQSKTDTGAIVGLRLGGIYAVDANNEIEFGIKGDYIKTNILDIDKATNYGVYVGYNYKF